MLLPTATPTLEPTPEPTIAPTATIDGILIEFRTKSRVYVEAAVDGKQVVAETLAPGTDRQLPLAQTPSSCAPAMGSAIDITVNGARQDPQTAATRSSPSWQR